MGRIFTEVTVGASDLVFFWPQPAVPHPVTDPIVKYEVQIKDENAADWIQTVEFTYASSLSGLLAPTYNYYQMLESTWGVTSGTTYVVELRACNGAGCAPWYTGSFTYSS